MREYEWPSKARKYNRGPQEPGIPPFTWAFIIGGITLLSVLALTEGPLTDDSPKPEPYIIPAWENPMAGDLRSQSQCVATRLPYEDPDGRKYTSWRISCEDSE